MSRKLTVPKVYPIMQAFKRLPGNEVGGNLHVVLDDDNVEDHFVQQCLAAAEREGDTAAVELARLLLQMSESQRQKLADLFLNCTDPDAAPPPV